MIEGEIVEEGPIGDGRCTQKSYRVKPADADALWLHFEHCADQGGPSPSGRSLDALEVGGRYRFEVQDGGSPNFGDAPLLLDAKAL